MRVILAAIFAVFCLLAAPSQSFAGAYSGNGAYSGKPSSAVVRAFAAFPNGGDGLVAALRALILSDPTLADDVAYIGARGNGEQQAAAGAALAQALVVLLNRGDNGAAGRLVNAAQQSGSATIQTAVGGAVGGSLGQVYQGGGLVIGTGCKPTVSPASSC